MLRHKWEEIPVTWPFLFGFCIFCLGDGIYDAICDMLMWSNLTNQTTYKYIISPYLTTTTSYMSRESKQDQSHVFLVFFSFLAFFFFSFEKKKIYVMNITGPQFLYFCQVLIGQNKILGRRYIYNLRWFFFQQKGIDIFFCTT